MRTISTASKRVTSALVVRRAWPSQCSIQDDDPRPTPTRSYLESTLMNSATMHVLNCESLAEVVEESC